MERYTYCIPFRFLQTSATETRIIYTNDTKKRDTHLAEEAIFDVVFEKKVSSKQQHKIEVTTTPRYLVFRAKDIYVYDIRDYCLTLEKNDSDSSENAVQIVFPEVIRQYSENDRKIYHILTPEKFNVLKQCTSGKDTKILERMLSYDEGLADEVKNNPIESVDHWNRVRRDFIPSELHFHHPFYNIIVSRTYEDEYFSIYINGIMEVVNKICDFASEVYDSCNFSNKAAEEEDVSYSYLKGLIERSEVLTKKEQWERIFRYSILKNMLFYKTEEKSYSLALPQPIESSKPVTNLTESTLKIEEINKPFKFTDIVYAATYETCAIAVDAMKNIVKTRLDEGAFFVDTAKEFADLSITDKERYDKYLAIMNEKNEQFWTLPLSAQQKYYDSEKENEFKRLSRIVFNMPYYCKNAAILGLILTNALTETPSVQTSNLKAVAKSAIVNANTAIDRTKRAFFNAQDKLNDLISVYTENNKSNLIAITEALCQNEEKKKSILGRLNHIKWEEPELHEIKKIENTSISSLALFFEDKLKSQQNLEQELLDGSTEQNKEEKVNVVEASLPENLQVTLSRQPSLGSSGTRKFGSTNSIRTERMSIGRALKSWRSLADTLADDMVMI